MYLGDDIPRETIVGPAIRHNGKVYSLPAPNRHHHIFAQHCTKYKGVIVCSIADGEQGFITSDGRFVDRVIGRQIAEAAGQIKNGPVHHKELFTEDMW